MMSMVSARRFLWVLAAVQLVAAHAGAAPITRVVVFGDSLIDPGTGYYPIAQQAAQQGRLPEAYPVSPPYHDGRFSNGPVASEYLAAMLGVPLESRAQGGATTGIGNSADGGTQSAPGFLADLGTAGVLKQVTDYAEPIDPDALYIVWGGPNNFINLLSATPTPEELVAAIDAGVSDLVTASGQLMQGGARRVLVPGMPDLGLTPRARAAGPFAQFGGSAVTDVFNAALVGALAQFLPGALYYDTASYMRAMVADPAAYGLLNATTPCKPGSTAEGVPQGESQCTTPDLFLFWDDLHPTTVVHQLVAREFATRAAADVPATVPEPVSVALLGAGLALAPAIARRRTTRQG